MKTVPERIFVTGTDTGVGKTVVSLLLMHLFLDLGLCPGYFKPVQTGCSGPDDPDCDARFIACNIAVSGEKRPVIETGSFFPAPKAPWFAARNRKERIDLSSLAIRADALHSSCSPLIVEGAGGVLVPFNSRETTPDLIRALQARTVLVARSGLGTINHTLLSLKEMDRYGIAPLGVVLVHTTQGTPDPGLVAENIEAVTRLGNVPVAGPVPWLKDCSAHLPGFRDLFAPLFRGLP